MVGSMMRVTNRGGFSPAGSRGPANLWTSTYAVQVVLLRMLYVPILTHKGFESEKVEKKDF